MKNTAYKLEVVFETDKGPKELDALSIESALLTALSISVGRQITVKGGDLKISMFEGNQTQADSAPFRCDSFGYKKKADSSQPFQSCAEHKCLHNDYGQCMLAGYQGPTMEGCCEHYEQD